MPQFDPQSIKKYRLLLWPLALFYRLLIFWRNIYYNIGFFVSRKLPCKVISIGNLSLGGTGKTPFVLYLANTLKTKGLSVAVLSRGYKRKSSGTLVVSDGQTIQSDLKNSGDEPFMLAEKLDGVPVVVDENRYRGGQFICKEFKPDIILLDDAFQHRRVYRDVDIVLINSAHRQPKLLPYGLLREPLKNVRRADAVIFTKANLTPPSENLINQVSKYCGFTIQSELLPEANLIGFDGSAKPLNEINGSVVAVSGVGDPDSFEVILEEAGLDYIHHFRHDDHADYTEMDLEVIREVYLSAEAEAIITTEKDLAKLEPLKDLPLFALPVSVSLSVEDEERLLELVNVP
ncbi:MAG: tetraacyldisaccharide 4'-kinase [Candidatus Marinimicrobia bacterium]|nr:tetraacyldisaccharide 4'-kinase [Candidatus Neomarinimicrobiota bacterium]